MKRSFCRAKIVNAAVTSRRVAYEGSCGIDAEILRAAGVHPYEWILVINTSNAERFETYAIAEPAGSGTVALYGGAALLAEDGDSLIILTRCDLEEKEVESFRGPKVVLLKPGNRVH